MNMKFLLAILVASLYVATAEKLTEKEGYFFEKRPRLGHFKEHPFTDLYKSYVAADVAANPDHPRDGYRNYLPSGDECITFLKTFRINQYQVRNLDEFIVLDACLGYLYESEYHETDSAQNPYVRDNLEEFKNDAKLKDLYQNTQINTISLEAQECVGDLLFKALRAKKQFPDKTCSSDWIQLLNEFAECQNAIPENLRASDSYLTEVYGLVKRRGIECFNAEVHALNVAVRAKYASGVLERAGNTLLGPLKSLRNQAAERMLPAKVIEVLRAVQGTKQEVNNREVSNIIRGVIIGNENFKERFLNNIAKYANEKINPKAKDKENRVDPSGVQRYERLIDDMCNYFRQSDTDDKHDFATPFVRMVQMIQYPDILGVDHKTFVKDVFNAAYETAPLYLSVSSCNLLTFTEGAFAKQANNAGLSYRVQFRPDTTAMVKWPDSGYY